MAGKGGGGTEERETEKSGSREWNMKIFAEEDRFPPASL